MDRSGSASQAVGRVRFARACSTPSSRLAGTKASDWVYGRSGPSLRNTTAWLRCAAEKAGELGFKFVFPGQRRRHLAERRRGDLARLPSESLIC